MIMIIVSIPNSLFGQGRRSEFGGQIRNFVCRFMFIPAEARGQIRRKLQG